MIRSLKNHFRRQRLHRAGIRAAGDYPRQSYGSGDGSWLLCPQDLNADSVIYSFGVGRDLSFDLALIQHHGAQVHAFDPTPASIAWVAEQSLPDKLHFHPMGLAAFDGDLPFYPPRKARSAHYTPVKRYRSESEAPIMAPVKRLQTLMTMLGHDRIDLLKIDIEGGEYEVLADMLECGIAVRQLLVEFHHMYQTIPLQRTLDTVHRLQSAGFEPIAISDRSYEISFMRSTTGNLLQEPQ